MRLPTLSRLSSLLKAVGTNGVQVAMEAAKVKVLAHALGAAGYGGLSLINSIAASINAVTCCGLNSAVADVLRRSGSADSTEIRRQTLIFAIILALCSVPISGVWVWAISAQYADVLAAPSLLLVVALAPIAVVSCYIVGLVVGIGSTDQVLVLRMASPAVALVAILAASLLGFLTTPGQAFFVSVTPALLVAAYFFRRLGMTRLVAWRTPDWSVASRLLALGAAFTASGFIQEAGNLVVKSNLASAGPESLARVGLYTAATTICYVPLRIAQSYFGIYRARILSACADDPDATARELRRASLVLCGIAAVAAVLLAASAGWLLRAFFNESFVAARGVLIGIAATLPFKIATLPYVYRCLIAGRYLSGLMTEASGSLGMLLGLLVLYDEHNLDTIVWAHVIGALVPLAVMPVTAWLHSRRASVS